MGHVHCCLAKCVEVTQLVVARLLEITGSCWLQNRLPVSIPWLVARRLQVTAFTHCLLRVRQAPASSVFIYTWMNWSWRLTPAAAVPSWWAGPLVVSVLYKTFKQEIVFEDYLASINNKWCRWNYHKVFSFFNQDTFGDEFHLLLVCKILKTLWRPCVKKPFAFMYWKC